MTKRTVIFCIVILLGVSLSVIGISRIINKQEKMQTDAVTDSPLNSHTSDPVAETESTPTAEPTEAPTREPESTPTAEPTEEPKSTPTAEPTEAPATEPESTPTAEPTEEPKSTPTAEPTEEPKSTPTAEPTKEPESTPSPTPTEAPTVTPTATPIPTVIPTAVPTITAFPTNVPKESGSSVFCNLSSIEAWESGEIDKAEGTEIDNKRRLRSVEYFNRTADEYLIQMEPEFRVYVYEYDRDHIYLGYKALVNGSTYYPSNGTVFFRIVLRKLYYENNMSLGQWRAYFKDDIECSLLLKDEASSAKESKYPSNVVVLGNSITLGFTTHGMASSDVDTDYYYHVNQYFLEKNPDVVMQRLSALTWEKATSSEERRDYLYLDVLPMLDQSTDLIIIQLGDNVNNKDRQRTFPEDCVEILQLLHAWAPKARILWVFGRYNQKYTSCVKQACEDNNAEFADISIVSTDEKYMAWLGYEYVNDKGEIVAIDHAGIASHPNDEGMKVIADIIIEQLGF